MDYAVAMQIFDSFNDLMQITLCFELGDPDSTFKELFKGIILAQFHDHINLAFKLERMAEFYNIRMIELPE